MATVTGLTAERMLEIEAESVVGGEVVGDDLILTKHDGTTINAGVVKGEDGVGGGIEKVTAFPTDPAPEDGDLIVRIDLPGDPIYKFSDGAWEQQPRMGAQVVPATRLRHSAAQSIPNMTDTALTWNTEDLDTDSMHDLVTNPTRITIKTPGLYSLLGHVVLTGATGGLQRELKILKNGTTILARNRQVSNGSFGASAPALGVSTTERLVAGDYLELIVNQDSGSANNVQTLANESPTFAATWLGGAGQTVDERGVPSAKISKAAAQSIATSTSTALSFTAEDFDTDGIADVGTTPTRLTAKTPGIYLLTGSAMFAGHATGRREIFFRKNGAGTISEDLRPGVAAQDIALTTEAVITLAAGDYVELMAWQDSGGALNITNMTFSMTLLGSGKTVTPFASVYKSVAQSLAVGSATTVSFDSEIADNDGIHDTVTNNERLTCKTAGVYHVNALISFSANSAGTRWLTLYKNGVAVHEAISDANANSTVRDTTVELNAIIELAVGDYLHLVASNIEGSSAVNLTSGSSGRGCKFSMVKIGAPISGNTGIEVVEGWHPVGSAGEPAFANGWLNYDAASYDALSFRKDRDRVYIRGSIKSGTADGPVFTLPAGYRPTKPKYLPVTAQNPGNMAGVATVDTGGNVGISRAQLGNTFVTLETSFSI